MSISNTGAIVLFEAYRQVDFDGAGTPIVYDNVSLNIGGGYDVASGVFTTKKRGYYMFTFNSLPDVRCGTTRLRTDLRLHRVTDAAPVFVASTTSQWPNVQSHIDYLKLRAGDKVILKGAHSDK